MKTRYGLFSALLVGALSLPFTSAFGDDDEDEYQEHSKKSSMTSDAKEPKSRDLIVKATNESWRSECSACHMAYPPGLLPAASWEKLMGNLGDHFGTDASLEPELIQEILPFLTAHARPAPPLPAGIEPTISITETAWFKDEHDEISAATWKRASIKSASNCMACHAGAEKGIFDEDSVKIPR